MLTPSGLTQFKGLNAQRILEAQNRTIMLPCINGGKWFSFRLEANEVTDPDEIGYVTKALPQNNKIGFGIEVPEGQVWFPYFIQAEAAFNTSTAYDCTFSPIKLEEPYIRYRRNVYTLYQRSIAISNQYPAFTGDQYPAAPYYRIGENPHNLSGVFKPQLYLGMWPSKATIWFDITADNALGISGGIDRLFFRGNVNVVYNGKEHLEQLREEQIADREIVRRLTSESVISFPNVTL